MLRLATWGLRLDTLPDAMLLLRDLNLLALVHHSQSLMFKPTQLPYVHQVLFYFRFISINFCHYQCKHFVPPPPPPPPCLPSHPCLNPPGIVTLLVVPPGGAQWAKPGVPSPAACYVTHGSPWWSRLACQEWWGWPGCLESISFKLFLCFICRI